MEICSKAINSAYKPYVMEIKVLEIEDLITQSVTKAPQTICMHARDAHFNTIGEDYLLVSMNRNAQILCLNSAEVLAEINLKKREMSTSLVFKELMFVGTYVDTIFVF